MYNLLSQQNAKTDKGIKKGYLTYTLQLSPNTTSGFNVCPSSTPECRANCNAFSGIVAKYPKTRGKIIRKRIERTSLYFNNKELFRILLLADVYTAWKNAEKKGYQLVLRLNCFSDLPWLEEIKTIKKEISNKIIFYDYTKIWSRIETKISQKKEDGYYLLFSWSGRNEEKCLKALKNNINVAVPFYPIIPKKFLGYPVIDGDIDDLRFLDPSPVIVGLKWKKTLQMGGNYGEIASPFVITTNP